MHPIEQLRHLARAGEVDGTLLALETAAALGELGREPRALVPACRRLLERHPGAGPLWWLCAEVLAGPDPPAAARRAETLLLEDPTAQELAASLPAGAVCAASCSAPVVEALAERPDCMLRLVGSAAELRRALRAVAGGPAAAEAVGFPAEQLEEAVTDASLLLVEPETAGPEGALVGPLAGSLWREARRAVVPIWLVAGVGKVLPAALFRVCAAAAEAAGGCQLLPAGDVEVVVGPTGALAGAEGLRRGGPAPPELLRPLG